jgi:RNA polymerase sigma factor (sigma-70 family)
MRKDLRPLVDVDDISQAMALRILRLLPDLNYMGRRPFRTWLRKLVVREIQKSADQLFAKKRDLRQSISLDELLKSGLYDDLPADDLVHKCRSIASSVAEIEQQRLLVLAIDELDSQTAELVRMVKLEGTTLREAATELQISESAAGKRMAKGLADLSYKMQSLFRDR